MARWLAGAGRDIALAVAVLAGFLLLAYVVLKLVPDWFAETEDLDAKGRADARQGVRTAALALLAGAIAVIGAIYTARTFALNRAGQLTDRFTKAIEQLGREEIDVCLGGIYALERIARDSKEDHPQVFEVLTAYVREHAPKDYVVVPHEPGDDVEAPGQPADYFDAPRARVGVRDVQTDVQAVLTVVGRRTLAHEQSKPPRLDLSGTALRRGKLANAKLRGTFLFDTDLGLSNCYEADLSKATLAFADLRGAFLSRADLSGADLSQADLSGADLTEANLTEANLFRADLTEAKLTEANLGRADLREAKLSRADLSDAVLSDADLTGATYTSSKRTKTTWPKDFDPEAAGASNKSRGRES